jgi:hypothetical protein
VRFTGLIATLAREETCKSEVLAAVAFTVFMEPNLSCGFDEKFDPTSASAVPPAA